MNNKYLDLLEFDKVLRLIADYAEFSMAKDYILQLYPSKDIVMIKQWLKQSSEGQRLLALQPNFSIGPLSNIMESVNLASKGKILDTMTLLIIKDTLSVCRIAFHNLKKYAIELPSLWDIVKNMTDLSAIEKEICHCIDKNGDIYDTASERLANIRSKLKDYKEQLNSKLEAILHSKRNQRFIQEAYITERDNRFVIPVKAEFKKEIKGIVHDVSNTGNTVFIEPYEIVDIGNDIRELVLEEKHEIERILGEISRMVGERADDIAFNLECMTLLEVVLAKARFAENAKATEPQIISMEEIQSYFNQNRFTYIKLVNARHPLIKKDPVPLNIEIGKDYNILVITGPNAGGKTVALKTIGLLSVMVQSGLPITADENSVFTIFDAVFPDIGDQQSIEQTLSTFSWHMDNIKYIIENATERSLVLFDELGISTDPEEGSALAKAILLYFLEKGIIVVSTTHYNDLKSFVQITPGMRNASMEFDPITLLPTYRLIMGIPGNSYAIEVAKNMGIKENIISKAHEFVGKGMRDVESLLAELTRERRKYEQMSEVVLQQKMEYERLLQEVQSIKSELQSKQEKLYTDITDILMQSVARFEKSLQELEKEARRVRKREAISHARIYSQKLLSELNSEIDSLKQNNICKEKGRTNIKIGDQVHVISKNLIGALISINNTSKTAEINIGSARLHVKLDDIELANIPASNKHLELLPGQKRRDITSNSLLRCDLRGKRVIEVPAILDKFLNDAYINHTAQVKVIHGLGTGALRNAVREYLQSHELVGGFRAADKEDGGDGVTLIDLKL